MKESGGHSNELFEDRIVAHCPECPSVQNVRCECQQCRGEVMTYPKPLQGSFYWSDFSVSEGGVTDGLTSVSCGDMGDDAGDPPSVAHGL